MNETKKDNKKKVLIIVLAALLLIGGGTAAILLQRQPAAPSRPTYDLTPGSEVQQGEREGADIEALQAELNRKVEAGMMNISMATNPVFETGTAAGEPRQRSISAQRAVFRIPQRTVAASSASSSPRKVHRASSQGAHDAGQKEAARAGGSQWPR